MTLSFLRFTMLPLALATAGCANDGQRPRDYATGYSYVSTAPGGSAKGVGGSVLVPNACLGAPADDDNPNAATSMTIVSGTGAHLPPSCANAFNLQQMVENKRDLLEGRRLGRAPAAPSARAARRYLDGEEKPLGGANEGTGASSPSLSAD